MRKYVVLRRIPKNNSFTRQNSLDRLNNIYDTSIKSSLMPFLSKRGYITGLKDDKEEARFEKDLRLEKGTLSPIYLEGKPSFWESSQMKITVVGVGVTIYIDDALGELKYKMLKAQPIVAPSMAQYNPEKHEYVIYEPEIEASIEVSKIEAEIEASDKFGKLTEEEIREVSTFFNLSTKGIVHQAAKTNLYKAIMKDPKKFITILTDPYYKKKVFVNKCVREGVLKHTSKGYFWADDTTVPIAYSLTEFVEKLEDKKTNEDLIINLEQKLAAAIKANKQ
jgi:hypothetical protein